MAQRKPDERAELGQVLKLVDQLSPEDREELCRKLDLKVWGERWRALCAKVDQQTKDLPPLTDDEILAEMKAIRREVQVERAQGSN